MGKFRVWTQFFYNGKWKSAGDGKFAESLDDAKRKGEELVAWQHKECSSSMFPLDPNDRVARRYVVAEVVTFSEAM